MKVWLAVLLGLAVLQSGPADAGSWRELRAQSQPERADRNAYRQRDVAVADAIDMTKGRGRIAFDLGTIDIHSVSALAIESVTIQAGSDRPIEIVVALSNSAGIFQVDQIFARKLVVTPLKDYVTIRAVAAVGYPVSDQRIIRSVVFDGTCSAATMTLTKRPGDTRFAMPAQISIQLTQSTYRPGDVVRGTVHLSAQADLRPRGIVVHAFGEEVTTLGPNTLMTQRWLAAQAVFFYMVSVAMTHDAAPWQNL